MSKITYCLLKDDFRDYLNKICQTKETCSNMYFYSSKNGFKMYKQNDCNEDFVYEMDYDDINRIDVFLINLKIIQNINSLIKKFNIKLDSFFLKNDFVGCKISSEKYNGWIYLHTYTKEIFCDDLELKSSLVAAIFNTKVFDLQIKIADIITDAEKNEWKDLNTDLTVCLNSLQK